ncbi:MAG: bifunctional phosphoribosyl-AMP cyclohydrolase/phosphoribosyl-ATP diphosphatase HisIE [Eubacteriaceae bacterium]
MSLSQIKYNESGLVPAIVQDYETRQVLMMAWMNEESLKLTLETKKATFFSRSRQKLWLKGETSGNTLTVIKLDYDCDGDTLLLEVLPVGPACHTGEVSCFYRNLFTDEEQNLGNSNILTALTSLIAQRKEEPVEGSYTNYLFEKGVDKICKKIGEEAAETIIAAKNNDSQELVYEASDLIYHLLVLLKNQSVDLQTIYKELTRRHQ